MSECKSRASCSTGTWYKFKKHELLLTSNIAAASSIIFFLIIEKQVCKELAVQGLGLGELRIYPGLKEDGKEKTHSFISKLSL